jgi:hypothetical protein
LTPALGIGVALSTIFVIVTRLGGGWRYSSRTVRAAWSVSHEPSASQPKIVTAASALPGRKPPPVEGLSDATQANEGGMHLNERENDPCSAVLSTAWDRRPTGSHRPAARHLAAEARPVVGWSPPRLDHHRVVERRPRHRSWR